ncbi:hypothetical protein [Terrisporobacter hibernicus]|uniref:Uncharacterized protein n=1 Tax=Terrisporobacter hibernicus TaxID=2813371 RepID=A0AAX2ZHQ2_9FIRM|nr:hypothetical protein [Terrisporobacter hibernicus]UEL47212.1 hypothetical protein JW646_16500 [Terrisporobacter hibernicus]
MLEKIFEEIDINNLVKEIDNLELYELASIFRKKAVEIEDEDKILILSSL